MNAADGGYRSPDERLIIPLSPRSPPKL